MNILDCSTDSTDSTDSNGSVGFAIDTTPWAFSFEQTPKAGGCASHTDEEILKLRLNS